MNLKSKQKLTKMKKYKIQRVSDNRYYDGMSVCTGLIMRGYTGKTFEENSPVLQKARNNENYRLIETN